MRTNSQINSGLKGKALEKPPTFFKNDQDIARWVRWAMNKLEPGGSAEDPSFQLACFLAASSVVGPDEDRIARMFGLRSDRTTLWTANLRRGGIWRDATVCCQMWHDDQCGFLNFIMAMLVAEGLIESRLDDSGETMFRAVASPQLWQKN